MTARIRTEYSSTGIGGPWLVIKNETSRDDLRRGYYVRCTSIDAAASYLWSLAFTPDSAGPAAAVVPPNDFNGTASSAQPINLASAPDVASAIVYFLVDFDGSYLINLTVDLTLPSEDTQYVRARSMTRFGNLKLPSAGERRDALGIIPVDVDATGWTDDLNQNLLRLTALIRRGATSGRVLYVDANRGRDDTQTPNDPTNIIRFPGPDSTFVDETGIRARAEGFGDFSTITSAITYALAGTRPDDPAPSATDPYFIMVKPGLYNETVGFSPFVHVVADGMPEDGVVVRSNAGTNHTYVGPAISDTTLLWGLTLENDGSVDDAVLVHNGGILRLFKCRLDQRRVAAANKSALTVDGTAFDALAWLVNCSISTDATGLASYAASTIGTGVAELRLDRCVVFGPSAIESNRNTVDGHSLSIGDTTISTARGGLDSGYGVIGQPSTLNIRDCIIQKTGVPGALESILLGPYTSAPGALSVEITNTTIKFGSISVDPTGVVGTKDLIINNVDMQGGTIVFPALPGPTIGSHTLAKSLGYKPAWIKPETGILAVPAPDQLTANTVQDAIDELAILVASAAAGGPVVYNLVSKAFGNSGYTLGATDYIVGWDTTLGAVTFNLPLVGSCTNGRIIVVKDEGGVAGITNITIVPGAGTTLEAGISPINVNGGSVTLYYNSALAKWFMT